MPNQVESPEMPALENGDWMPPLSLSPPALPLAPPPTPQVSLSMLRDRLNELDREKAMFDVSWRVMRAEVNEAFLRSEVCENDAKVNEILAPPPLLRSDLKRTACPLLPVGRPSRLMDARIAKVDKGEALKPDPTINDFFK